MRINIIGPGAMGLILSYYLSRKNQVSLVVKKENLEKYRDIVIIEDGVENRINIPVLKEPDECDFTIIAVKSYDLQNVLNSFRLKGRVLFIQNGLSHLSIKSENIEKFYAVTTWAGRRIDKGKVEVTGKGYFKIGGESKIDISFLRDSGINAEWNENIEAEIFRKAGINSVINPLTALFKVRNGELIANPYLWNIARIVSAESSELMNRIGYNFNVEEDVRETCRVTSKNMSSMFQDISNGRRTEIDSINGELIKIGREKGMDMPVNNILLNSILFLENNQN